jgi:hypothetical protein
MISLVMWFKAAVVAGGLVVLAHCGSSVGLVVLAVLFNCRSETQCKGCWAVAMEFLSSGRVYMQMYRQVVDVSVGRNGCAWHT